MKYTIDLDYEFTDKIVLETLKEDYRSIESAIEVLENKVRESYESEDLKYDRKLKKALKRVLKYYMNETERNNFFLENSLMEETPTIWTKYSLSQLLSEHVRTVTFRKKDGTIRDMTCTLLPLYLPDNNGSTSSKIKSTDVMAVWDVDNNGWRSFRIDSIIHVSQEK